MSVLSANLHDFRGQFGLACMAGKVQLQMDNKKIVREPPSVMPLD